MPDVAKQPEPVRGVASASSATRVIYSAENPAPQGPGVAATAPRSAYVINAKLNPMAGYSFVAGLLALFFNVFLIPSIFAVILGIRGLVRANVLSEAGEQNNLKTVALLGIAFGVVGAVIGIVQVALFVVSFVAGF